MANGENSARHTVGPPRDPAPYPFAELEAVKRKVIESGVELIDFGVGDPREETPLFIREQLVSSIDPVSSYPTAAGLPELRAAISSWIDKRFGADVHESDIVPTLGSKEIIHSLPAYVLDSAKDTVVVPTPAYPVYERGATFHGGHVHPLPLTPERRFLPELDAVPDAVWKRTALLWLNYPNNPTGVTAPLSLYEQAAELARKHDFLLASDEAYSEIYFGDEPASVLQLPDLTNVLAVNTLSKRSCMTGYRSGFIAGDPAVIKRIRNYRPSVGVTPQSFVQKASIAAWGDEDHVTRQLAIWGEKRRILLEALSSAGLRVENDATFFLWIKTPTGESAATFAERLLSQGLVVSPGSFFGAGVEDYVRLALVPPVDKCAQAADRLRQLFGVERSA